MTWKVRGQLILKGLFDVIVLTKKPSNFFNNRFLRERGMASNPKMDYQIFLCIFQKNSAMATLGLKEMGKFLQT
jgi:hypothetical protein